MADTADKELLNQIFRYTAWGEKEYARAIQIRLNEAHTRHVGSKEWIDEIEKSSRQGRKARKLWEEMESQLKSGNLPPTQANEWIEEKSRGLSRRIYKHLSISLKKWMDYTRTAHDRWKLKRATSLQCTLPQTKLINGHHPNSLRHLPAAPQWMILVDETGIHFDEQASALELRDNKLGRLVALAVPSDVNLPELRSGFHAAEITDLTEIDQAFTAILSAPVGVFGFTARDPAIRTSDWLGHVQELLRWTLLQLPLTQGPSTVECLVEQRADYTPSTDLDALAASLESELRRIDPARFFTMHLSLKIIQKKHPLNGYVDALAFTWGSPSNESRERLKRSALEGHCLIRPDDEAMQRLYLALNAHGELHADEWYTLCTESAYDPDGGILLTYLERLGEQIQKKPSIWRVYLDNVRERLRIKRFHLNELGYALEWLDRYTPVNTHLPDIQRLALETARMAEENHRGHINLNRARICIDLSCKLHDEAPAEACETLLRLVASASNAFEFNLFRPQIEEWIREPVAVPGLLNHAKLLSSLGQIDAFTGHTEAALNRFNEAIAAFQRLSDPAERTREMTQTQTYRLIALTDNASTTDEELARELTSHLQRITGKSTPEIISKSLARAGQESRYAHHLWLRAMVCRTGLLPEARKAYLAMESEWRDGDDHPWPLINAYRGWLLDDAGRKAEAGEYFRYAIENASDAENGPVLHWIAEVLRTVAQAKGIELIEAPKEQTRNELRTRLQHAPHDALKTFAETPYCDKRAVLSHVQQCLPFNFH